VVFKTLSGSAQGRRCSGAPLAPLRLGLRRVRASFRASSDRADEVGTRLL